MYIDFYLQSIRLWGIFMQEVKEKKETIPCKPENYELCCHFINAFQIIGKKWNGLIISSLCDTEDMRFKDLARCIEAFSCSISYCLTKAS